MMLIDDEMLANNNNGGNSSHKGKAIITEITNCIRNTDENVTRKFMQGSRKNIKKKDKMTIAYRQVTHVPFTNEEYAKSKSSNNLLQPVSKITEEGTFDSASVLRQLHTYVKDFGEYVGVSQEVNRSDLNVSTPRVDRSFDVVASELKEALTVISE